MEAVLAVIGAVNFFLGIYVLIKLFSQEGVLQGILGFLCMLYTFIWGWQNADALNIRNVMMAWSACIVIGIVAGGASGL